MSGLRVTLLPLDCYFFCIFLLLGWQSTLWTLFLNVLYKYSFLLLLYPESQAFQFFPHLYFFGMWGKLCCLMLCIVEWCCCDVFLCFVKYCCFVKWEITFCLLSSFLISSIRSWMLFHPLQTQCVYAVAPHLFLAQPSLCGKCICNYCCWKCVTHQK